jgi:HrpA-like RNA helicase
MADDEEVESALIPSLYKPPALLPIAQLKDQLLYTIETYPVTIVVGETGSGKYSCLLKHLTTDISPQERPHKYRNFYWKPAGAMAASK